MSDNIAERAAEKKRNTIHILDLLLIFVLLAGAYFRFIGINWGEYSFMHPDERFLVWVTADIAPVQSLSEYFDTATSSLNPNNRGHGFYVYGTLPIFLVRYLVNWMFETPGWNQIVDIGRPVSALSDLLVVGLVYLAASHLYNRRVGLLAGAFYALAVLPIQLSHYYKEDTIANFFTFLAIYFAVRIFTYEEGKGEWGMGDAHGGWETEGEPGGFSSGEARSESSFTFHVSHFLSHPFLLFSLGFGIALGCALASKLNTAPVAAMLPAAFALRLLPRSGEGWERRSLQALGYLALAAVVSVLIFRLFQPYAFSGTGFTGVAPNPSWVAQIREQRTQAAGDVDFPPALQWARRPPWFAWQNLVLWGLGLPLGLLAWAGFLWAGWRILKGDGRRHALLWGWTAFYFVWQSSAFNPTMRYLLPIYPALAVFAAWALVALYDLRRKMKDERRTPEDVSNDPSSPNLRRSPAFVLRPSSFVSVLIGGFVLIATFAWAFAFSRIYVRPFTRAEATRWFLQNIPGPINLRIQSPQGDYNQPLPFPNDTVIRVDQPFTTVFEARASGVLSEIRLAHAADLQPAAAPASLAVTITADADGGEPLAGGELLIDPAAAVTPGGWVYNFNLDAPLELGPGQAYTLNLQAPEAGQTVDVCGPLNLHIQLPDSAADQTLRSPAQCILRQGGSIDLPFTAPAGGILTQVSFQRVIPLAAGPGAETLELTLYSPGVEAPLATGTLSADLSPREDPRGDEVLLKLDRPVQVTRGEQFQLVLAVPSGQAAVSLSGSAVAVESSWDDGLLRVDGYDPYGGIYRGDLNLEMYVDDNADKLARFLDVLNRADAIYVSSNRQWGSIPRLPERYPLSSEYYRRLLGCPPEQDVVWCYTVAQEGMFSGDLGFELAAVFNSSPSLGPLRINDQFAEEAFTVYDHPKVLVFRKTADYDPEKVSAILGSVDLSQAVHITPRRAGSFPANLMLPESRWQEQSQGGTWSELFDTQALHNRYPALGVLLWYLSLGLLGLVVYPFVRLALPGLPDRGYPLARLAGLLLLAYLVWLAGSARIPFSRLTISIVLAGLALAGAVLAYRQRAGLRREWRERRGYFLMVEGLFLAFFLFDLLIRYGNPDLWHPAHGGEKPMDFSYFNAVLKSTSFPPYDPWFAGGYLNYYYYGFVLFGVPVKWLGIVPSVAYNLILPTVFSLIALGAFSLGWNLFSAWRLSASRQLSAFVYRLPPFIPAIAAALGMAVLGNLGTLRMIYRGFQMLAAPGGVIEGASLPTRLVWAFLGFLQALAGADLPYGPGDWYWLPSRAIPAPGDVEPITEFPFFTILYGDPHAHLFALPITLLVLAFALSVVLYRSVVVANGGVHSGGMQGGRAHSRAPLQGPVSLPGGGSPEAGTRQVPPDSQFLIHNRLPLLGGLPAFILGGLAIGALRPTNTWDFYPYLALGCAAVGYALWTSFSSRAGMNDGRSPQPESVPPPVRVYDVQAPGQRPAVQQSETYSSPTPPTLRAQEGGAQGLAPLQGRAAQQPGTYPSSTTSSGGVQGVGVYAGGAHSRAPLQGGALLRAGSYGLPLLDRLPDASRRLLATAGGVLLLVFLSFVLYQPYAVWYGQGYNQVALWKGTHTPTTAYLVHWGLFLFLIVSWMAWETRDWMASTPLSSLRKLEPYKGWIQGTAGAVLAAMLGLLLMDIAIAWLVLPLAVWAGVLILRPGQPDAKRFVLFLVGTGLVLTLMVEVIVLVGDIGRMNTVFKFYLGVWTLFAISAATSLGWLLSDIALWFPRWRTLWQVVLAALVFSAALYPLMAGLGKVKNRMALQAPHTLDGMDFMEYAEYGEAWGVMDLSQDYEAIRWMQENVPGSPVIVEGNVSEYRWGSRFSIYTGLPGVIGWNWHQRQQRVLMPDTLIWDRINQVAQFYQTTDLELARDFLKKYDVGYIILGQQERGLYPGPGLDKFPAAEGVLWREVYRQDETVIYEVLLE